MNGQDPFEELLAELGSMTETIRTENRLARLVATNRWRSKRQQQQDIQIAKHQVHRLSLRKLVAESIPRIRCYIPADRDLFWEASEDPCLLQADSETLLQMIFDLAAHCNRDCHGGSFTLQSRKVQIEAESSQARQHGKAGAFIMLRMILTEDSANGMHRLKTIPVEKRPPQPPRKNLSELRAEIEAMGGFLQMYNHQAHNLTCELFLPEAKATPPKPKVYRIQSQLRDKLENRTVLLVDPDRMTRSVVRKMLVDCGCLVQEASDGIEAEEYLLTTENTIDLCVLDMNIEKKHGCQVYCELHQLFPHIKVIFTCAGEPEPESTRLIHEFKIPFLARPFELNRLLQTMADCFSEEPDYTSSHQT